MFLSIMRPLICKRIVLCICYSRVETMNNACDDLSKDNVKTSTFWQKLKVEIKKNWPKLTKCKKGISGFILFNSKEKHKFC